MDSSPPAAPLQLPVPKVSIPQVSIPEMSIPEVSIIIPARNEEADLGNCLESLTAQTGVAFEIIVVDDESTDRTRQIAESFAGVRVISAEPRPIAGAGKAWTGKNNALVTGANSKSDFKVARAPWLLFTDADTVHLPGSLTRALCEAKKEQAYLLSYSPEQIVVTFSERAVMPVIFAELAAEYPPRKVRDQNSGIVAANGQYILVRRAAYDTVGGHVAVATEILEDVALARLFRDAGQCVYFRYGGDAVRTRMYRDWPQLREGWTKNLALLFPKPEFLAFQSLYWWFAAWLALAVAVYGATARHFLMIVLAAVWLLLYRRIRGAQFATLNNLIAIAAGPPMFAYLLLRSKKARARGQVSWKDRVYEVGEAGAAKRKAPTEAQSSKPIPNVEHQRLKAES